MLSRTEYLAKELSRHGGLAPAAEVMTRHGPCTSNPESKVLDPGPRITQQSQYLVVAQDWHRALILIGQGTPPDPKSWTSRVSQVLEPGIKALRDFTGKCSSSAVTETVGSTAGGSSHAAGAKGMEGTSKV
jgi:hypothetical protein